MKYHLLLALLLIVFPIEAMANPNMLGGMELIFYVAGIILVPVILFMFGSTFLSSIKMIKKYGFSGWMKETKSTVTIVAFTAIVIVLSLAVFIGAVLVVFRLVR